MTFNETQHQSVTLLGTRVILSGIFLSIIGIIFNLIMLILMIRHAQHLKRSKKNTSCRIDLLHSINTYIHLLGILSALFLMCLRTVYGDLYLTTRDEYPIVWHCRFLGYLVPLFGAGVYGSCFLQALFRYWRIMLSTRHRLQKPSFHILLILTHWILIITLLSPTFPRSMYIQSDHFCFNPFDDRYIAAYVSFITVLIPVGGISILYIRIFVYMRNHLQTRKKRRRMRNGISKIRRILFLVIIILQTSTTAIILWILTFFIDSLHFYFYRFLRIIIIVCMLICSIALVVLSPQLRRALRSNRGQHPKKKETSNPKIFSKHWEEAAPCKNLTGLQT